MNHFQKLEIFVVVDDNLCGKLDSSLESLTTFHEKLLQCHFLLLILTY